MLHTYQVGMVVFTQRAFLIFPLTEDVNTLFAMLDELSPSIMPVLGNNVVTGLKESTQLIKQAGFSEGQIILLTANPVVDNQAILFAKNLAKERIQLSILDIRNPNNHSQSTEDHVGNLEKMANEGKGNYTLLTLNNDDIQQLLKHENTTVSYMKNTNQPIKIWKDQRWYLIPFGLFRLSSHLNEDF